MKKQEIKRTSQNVSAIQSTDQGTTLGVASPDSFADSVRVTLSRVPLELRFAVYNKLLTTLKRANVNLRQLVLMLGIPADTIYELTAADLAQLIRYVRITDPRAMNVLLPFLDELIAQHAPPRIVKVSKRAA